MDQFVEFVGNHPALFGAFALVLLALIINELHGNLRGPKRLSTAEAIRLINDSDALIVRGIIAVLSALYNGVAVSDVPKIDAKAELGRLSLEEHLSAQRSNGLKAMIQRINKLAVEAA